jgi:hypothetical protein
VRVARILALMLVGCGQAADPDPFYPAIPNPDARKEKDENEIRIVAFRQMLKHASPGEIGFISFEETGIDGWIYPSNEFMARLVFPQLTLRSVAEARRDPGDRSRTQGVRDAQTGAPCTVYSVRVEWLTPDRAKAHAALSKGRLSGGRFEYLIVRESGGWGYKETVAGRAN